jgi:hypothetical protein
MAAGADGGDLQDLVRRLRDRLARFDNHPATKYVDGGGHLSGYSLGRWEEARQRVEEARDVLRRYEAPNDRPVDEARRALAHAAVDVDAAIDQAGRIVRADLGGRAADIADRAEEVGADELAARTRDLSDRIRSSLEGSHAWNLRVTELELALAEVSVQAAAAAKLVRRARKGIDGFSCPRLPDLAPLADALGRLRALAASEDPDVGTLRERAAELEDDLDRARTQIRAVLKAAGDVVDRRGDLRGWLRALTRRAHVLGASTERDVEAAHQQLDELLWSAGCDLDGAERLLVRLTRMLDREEAPDA